ncbi:hypothetical protein EXIGLDRAFT_769163 [Exidia glandulosa HHB12029]|uniref:F-box domain-containing protein n=1 Tax=Exidia glandulosa HHB12029 TaxID=1314781 RepID=A0A165HQ34_EXIGL|nr:hypothetical protein EXIGLDRAFT_769163 [Exidia glandulosa HHB12029]
MSTLVTLPEDVLSHVFSGLEQNDNRSLACACRRLRTLRGRGWRVLDFHNHTVARLVTRLQSLIELLKSDKVLALAVREVSIRYVNMMAFAGRRFKPVPASEKAPFKKFDPLLSTVLRLTRSLETFVLDGPPGIGFDQMYPKSIDAICTLPQLRVLIIGRVHGAKEDGSHPYTPKLASTHLTSVIVAFPIQLDQDALVRGQRHLQCLGLELDGTESGNLGNDWTDLRELRMDNLWVSAEVELCWDLWVDITRNALAAGALRKLDFLYIRGPATYAQLDTLVTMLSREHVPLTKLYFIAQDENMKIWPEFGPATLLKIFRAFPLLESLCIDNDDVDINRKPHARATSWPRDWDDYLPAFLHAQSLKTFIMPAGSVPSLHRLARAGLASGLFFREALMDMFSPMLNACPTLTFVGLGDCNDLGQINLFRTGHEMEVASPEHLSRRFFWLSDETRDVAREGRYMTCCGVWGKVQR